MYQPDENESKIEDVKKSLYSRNADGIFLKRRHAISEKKEPAFQSAWTQEEKPMANRRTFHIPYIKILVIAFFFFVAALGFTFYKFFIGSNTVSGDNINIVLSGPASIAGGETLPLDI